MLRLVAHKAKLTKLFKLDKCFGSSQRQMFSGESQVKCYTGWPIQVSHYQIVKKAY